MKNILNLLIVQALIFASCGPTRIFNSNKDQIRILSYNIRNCLGNDGRTDYQRISDIISGIRPDLAALQELDSATARSKGVFVLGHISALTGMHMTYAPAISFQGGKYGIGVLTREKPVGWEVIPLPGREERRALLVVELKDYVFCCTHFSLTEEDREKSAEIINSRVMTYNKPVFLAGDLNAVPQSQVLKIFEKSWSVLNDTTQPTIPSSGPERCIDYILALKSDKYSFETIRSVIEKEPLASDHLPVWADIKIMRSSRK